MNPRELEPVASLPYVRLAVAFIASALLGATVALLMPLKVWAVAENFRTRRARCRATTDA